MTTNDSKARNQAQIRELTETVTEAVHSKDLDGLMSNYAPDVVSYDALDPLQYVGQAESRKRAEEWFSSYKTPIGFEISDLSITAGDDVAFCHYLYHVSGTLNHGGKVDMWVRSTVCYSKIDGKWMITHEHTSVPFDGESGKASLNLKPK
ncbi:MAG: nuclear transport factor 2 family protein [Chloroflexota bacterium]|nr:nuclear transport factor 2 family protein [Chloroflexota bacterium]